MTPVNLRCCMMPVDLRSYMTSADLRWPDGLTGTGGERRSGRTTSTTRLSRHLQQLLADRRSEGFIRDDYREMKLLDVESSYLKF